VVRVGWLARTPDEERELPEPTSPSAGHPFELAAVDLTTTDGRFTGWIATDGERTSDWLNHNDELLVRGLNDIALSAEDAEPGLPVSSGLGEQRLQPEDVIFVVPPPLPPNRHLRLHRRKVRIHLDVGSYRVVGQLHVRPGASAGDYVLRSSRNMVPLTEVELLHTAEPEFRRLLPVVIINARHVTRMQEAEQRGRPLLTSAHARLGPVEAPTPKPAPAQADAPQPDTARPRVTPDAMAALRLLLDAGLLDVTEFQVKRAELLARPQA